MNNPPTITKKVIAFGSKKIYLPKFTIALTRSPQFSPYHARFLVPLDFSKYDLRDYLYHAYKVRCFNIRSYVKQMPVRDTNAQQRHWFREDSKKYMTVEMEQPFVWPKIPDLELWGKSTRQDEIKTASADSEPKSSIAARDEAWALRKEVEKLFKRETPSESTEKSWKRPKGSLLTKEQKEKSDRREAHYKKSRLESWEAQRTAKVVGDTSRKYA